MLLSHSSESLLQIMTVHKELRLCCIYWLNLAFRHMNLRGGKMKHCPGWSPGQMLLRTYPKPGLLHTCKTSNTNGMHFESLPASLLLWYCRKAPFVFSASSNFYFPSHFGLSVQYSVFLRLMSHLINVLVLFCPSLVAFHPDQLSAKPIARTQIGV